MTPSVHSTELALVSQHRPLAGMALGVVVLVTCHSAVPGVSWGRYLYRRVWRAKEYVSQAPLRLGF